MSVPDDKPFAIRWVYGSPHTPDMIPLDEGGALNKVTLLRSLAEHFAFPEYFGDNWDAAYDLLLDHVEQLSGPITWRFFIRSGIVVSEADLDTWLQLMADVGNYARSQNVQLQIEVYSAAHIA